MDWGKGDWLRASRKQNAQVLWGPPGHRHQAVSGFLVVRGGMVERVRRAGRSTANQRTTTGLLTGGRGGALKAEYLFGL